MNLYLLGWNRYPSHIPFSPGWDAWDREEWRESQEW